MTHDRLNDPQRIDYMLRRSIGILFASGWSAGSYEGAVDVQPQHVGSDEVVQVYCVPLLFVLNALAMWRSYEDSVLNPLEQIIDNAGARQAGSLDIQRMIEVSQLDGVLSPVFRTISPDGQIADHRLAALVAVEYHAHLEIACSFVKRWPRLFGDGDGDDQVAKIEGVGQENR